VRRAIAADPSVAGRRRRRLVDVYLSPRRVIPRRSWFTVAVAAFVAILAAWAVAAIIKDTPILLPGPGAVARAWVEMFGELGFARDVGWSAFRVIGGFILAAVIAVPLGVFMGTFEIVRAFFEPPINAIRYMPASAFIPLLILLQGLGEDEKLTVIWIGVFFPLVLMVVDTAHRVPIEMLHTAYTLGASRWTVLRKVLLPAMLPDVVDALRITMGWAWTYLIVAELVAATAGIGYFILVAQRYLRSDRIIAAILTIGALGLVTDLLFGLVHRYAFPYVEKVRR
jgi:NitT/TauT family transport system permease protein